MSARYIVGDVFDVLATIPDGSVDLVLTSPPFLALRSYLPVDHPDKAKEIGSEPTPAAFLDTLLALCDEWRRLLAPHGSICVELGDTYSGSGGAGGDYNDAGLRAGQERFDGSARRSRAANDWPLDKSLCLTSQLFAASLAYGRNMLTGRVVEPWRVRNIVRWCRPNPPVGALGDKFRPATSEMVIACTSRTRYFDLDAVRVRTGNDRDDRGHTEGRIKDKSEGGGSDHGVMRHVVGENPSGAPPLDWWAIPTEPYAGSHYATWPRDLLTRPILAMCPQRVCRTCGEPSRRVVEVGDLEATADARITAWDRGKQDDGGSDGMAAHLRRDGFIPNHVKPRATVDWADCGHDDWRLGVVLDPFAGSGTTLAVATGHGREALGIDLDERNAELARQRVGMLLDVTTFHVEPCKTCDGERVVDRLATPQEVEEGCELGVAFDPCPDCVGATK